MSLPSTFGRYRLLERIGQGGMAEVFKAKSYGASGFEKLIVIKRILPELAAQPQFVDLFIREAKLTVRLSHANVVQVFDLGVAPLVREDGEPIDAYYMASEYVHGVDLGTLLAQARRTNTVLSISMSAHIAIEVAKALEHAHRRRDDMLQPLAIVHRDISPANILLSFEGEVKVSDFGIASAQDAIHARASLEDTLTRKLRGKFGYMSPEQARGEPVGPGSDIFSLGCVLYESLTGVGPFHAPSTFETLRRVHACEYTPLVALRPDVPPELAAIVQQAMAPLPDDRFSDAGRMHESLLNFLFQQRSRFTARELGECIEQLQASAPAASSGAAPALIAPANVTNAAHASASVLPELDASTREATVLLVDVAGSSLELKSNEELALLANGLPPLRLVRTSPTEFYVVFYDPSSPPRDLEQAAHAADSLRRAALGSGAFKCAIHMGLVHVTPKGDVQQSRALNDVVASTRDYVASAAPGAAGRIGLSPQAARGVRRIYTVVRRTDPDAPMGSAILGEFRAQVASEEPSPTFVGQHDVFQRLGEIFSVSSRGKSRRIAMSGPAGAGKTALLNSLASRIADARVEASLHNRKGQAPPTLFLWRTKRAPVGVPRAPFADLVDLLAAIVEGCDPSAGAPLRPGRFEATLESRLHATGLSQSDQDVVRSACSPLHQHGVSSDAAMTDAATVTRCMIAVLGLAVTEGPCILAWDDADHLTAEIQQVLADVFVAMKDAPVTMVFASRVRGSFTGAVTELTLSPLTINEVQQVAEGILNVRKVPSELAQYLFDVTQGNPGLLTECVYDLLSARSVTVAKQDVVSVDLARDASWLPTAYALPLAVRRSVATRFMALAAAQKRTLVAAATLGEPCEHAHLLRMLGDGPYQEALQTLEREWLSQLGPAALTFRSPVLASIILESIAPAERAAYRDRATATRSAS